jgi:hypothetical protein
MNKQTKKTLMSLSIILVFALSSIAFVFSGFGHNQQQQQLTPLTSFVVAGDIDPRLEEAYINAGYTFLKLYHGSSLDQSVIIFAEQAPSVFTTPTGQTQLVVQKLASPVDYATIVNGNGAEDYYNLTADVLLSGLCTHLIAASPECAVLGLNLTY